MITVTMVWERHEERILLSPGAFPAVGDVVHLSQRQVVLRVVARVWERVSVLDPAATERPLPLTVRLFCELVRVTP